MVLNPPAGTWAVLLETHYLADSRSPANKKSGGKRAGASTNGRTRTDADRIHAARHLDRLRPQEMASRIATPTPRPQQRTLVSKQEAAAALAMSVRHFERYVQANVPCVHCGQLTLYRPRDLERWADSRATPRVR